MRLRSRRGEGPVDQRHRNAARHHKDRGADFAGVRFFCLLILINAV